jgi:hypothetical protein
MPTAAAKDAIRGKSTLGSWVKAVCRAADAAGCDSAALLAEAGVSLNSLRHDLALAYLSAPRHTVSDVTFLLGFSAGSCFTRAFRRWTGQSPTAWRAEVEAGRRAPKGGAGPALKVFPVTVPA